MKETQVLDNKAQVGGEIADWLWIKHIGAAGAEFIVDIDNEGVTTATKESGWGESQIVVGRGAGVRRRIDHLDVVVDPVPEEAADPFDPALQEGLGHLGAVDPVAQLLVRPEDRQRGVLLRHDHATAVPRRATRPAGATAAARTIVELVQHGTERRGERVRLQHRAPAGLAGPRILLSTTRHDHVIADLGVAAEAWPQGTLVELRQFDRHIGGGATSQHHAGG